MSLSFVIKRELIINRDTNCSLITLSGKVTLASALVAKILFCFFVTFFYDWELRYIFTKLKMLNVQLFCDLWYPQQCNYDMFWGKSSDNGGTVAINWELNYYVALHKLASYNTISHPRNSHNNHDQKKPFFFYCEERKWNEMNIISKNSLQPSKVFLPCPTPSILGESEPWEGLNQRSWEINIRKRKRSQAYFMFVIFLYQRYKHVPPKSTFLLPRCAIFFLHDNIITNRKLGFALISWFRKPYFQQSQCCVCPYQL